MTPHFNLDGKTAIITGAAGLLGGQHAKALMEAGANVILTDLRGELLNSLQSELAAQAFSGRIEAFEMDVTDSESIAELERRLNVDNINANILINNAAIDAKVTENVSSEEFSRLENFSLEQWNLELNVGLTGAFLCSQTFGTAMARSGNGGVILNIASDLSIASPDQRLYRKSQLADDAQPVKPITYPVIKSALIGLTRYLSTYWAEQEVRCNALSPGGVLNGQSEEFLKRIEKLIPAGRLADVDEYQGAVQFLCSDASKYLNGQNIVMDGGRSVW